MNQSAALLEPIVLSAVKNVFDELGMDTGNLTASTPLYGTREGISSLSLVRLIVDLEEAVEINFNKTITIADDKVLSQHHSPFNNVGTLLAYLQNLLSQ